MSKGLGAGKQTWSLFVRYWWSWAMRAPLVGWLSGRGRSEASESNLDGQEARDHPEWVFWSPPWTKEASSSLAMVVVSLQQGKVAKRGGAHETFQGPHQAQKEETNAGTATAPSKKASLSGENTVQCKPRCEGAKDARDACPMHTNCPIKPTKLFEMPLAWFPPPGEYSEPSRWNGSKAWTSRSAPLRWPWSRTRTELDL